MGRPIEKRLLGLTAGAGSQIAVTAFIPAANGGSSAVAGSIVRQRHARRFRCTTAQGTGLCKLVTTAPGAGEVRITVTDSAAGTYFVSKISGRTVTVVPGTGVQFTTGSKVRWNITGAVVSVSVLMTVA